MSSTAQLALFAKGYTSEKQGDDLATKDNKDASKPVTRHFNLPNHSKQHMAVLSKLEAEDEIIFGISIYHTSDSAFRARWLASSEVIGQVLFTFEQLKKNNNSTLITRAFRRKCPRYKFGFIFFVLRSVTKRSSPTAHA